MQKLFVTTDFSANSKAAIRFAIQFAKENPSEIVFYNIFEGVADNNWDPKKKLTSHKEERLVKLNKFIETIYKENAIKPGNYKCLVDIGIDTKNLILASAKKNKANLICISSRGGGVLKKLLGSTTSVLTELSPIPVIVVPKGYKIKK